MAPQVFVAPVLVVEIPVEAESLPDSPVPITAVLRTRRRPATPARSEGTTMAELSAATRRADKEVWEEFTEEAACVVAV
jgi:hypothetical protein